MGNKVLAMYDVRGIQKFIYRTPYLKDAMGASIIIENIVMEALCFACEELGISDKVLNWENENGVLPYDTSEHKVKVLYIGGGNAYVMHESRALCVEINKRMSKYVIEKTYSLQLATTYVEATENYREDYSNLMKKMQELKSTMTSAKPLGALPLMQAEMQTGFPLVQQKKEGQYREASTETGIKRDTKNRKIKELEEDKFLENYINTGKDSRLAVIHIDGNNMGLRIRKLVSDIDDYETAVNRMRMISHSIKYAYLNTFETMKKEFETKKIDGENVKRFVRKVIVAGDDITYVCNAHIALETVRFFCEKISGLTMNKGLDEKKTEQDVRDFGFSVCAGIAFVQSHFPFYTAYEVAESCCDEAKKAAKKPENMDGERIGNYVDFQICKNIQCRNLDETREREYVTPTKEKLLLRPYYIATEYEYGLKKNREKANNYKTLVENITYFSKEDGVPRSFLKELRNTYSLGKYRMSLLSSFLKSRNYPMPDGGYEMYDEETGTAKWYDALEILDYSLYIAKGEEKVNE